MKTLGYYNGTIGEIDEVRVPMSDRACYFGDGVYDATYSRNHRIYQLDRHIDRFYNSAAQLKITIPMGKEELAALLSELVTRVDDGEQFVYWQVSRGSAPRAHAFPQNTPANLWVMLTPSKTRDTYAKIRLTDAEDTRFFHCNIKTLNLIPSVMAAQKSAENDCDECIFHRGEIVTECAHSNVHIIQNGHFVTHPADNLILPGIARRNLLETALRLGIPTEERTYTMNELLEADEVVVSSSGSFCLAAESVSGRPVGGRAPELLKKLQDALTADFREKTDR